MVSIRFRDRPYFAIRRVSLPVRNGRETLIPAEVAHGTASLRPLSWIVWASDPSSGGWPDVLSALRAVIAGG